MSTNAGSSPPDGWSLQGADLARFDVLKIDAIAAPIAWLSREADPRGQPNVVIWIDGLVELAKLGERRPL